LRFRWGWARFTGADEGVVSRLVDLSLPTGAVLAQILFISWNDLDRLFLGPSRLSCLLLLLGLFFSLFVICCGTVHAVLDPANLAGLVDRGGCGGSARSGDPENGSEDGGKELERGDVLDSEEVGKVGRE